MTAKKLTEAQLAEIEARLAAATPGPWRVGRQLPNGSNNVGTTKGLLTAQTTDSDNAKLIANAPTDLAALCEALSESWRQHAECADAWADEHHERVAVDCENRRLSAEIDRLEAEAKRYNTALGNILSLDSEMTAVATVYHTIQIAQEALLDDET